jgi:hypothetical protein
MLTDKLHCILLPDYKLELPKYNINGTRFLWLEICAIEKWSYEFCPELSVRVPVLDVSLVLGA